MTYTFVIVLLLASGGVLWWRLSCERGRNAQLQAEIVKLRSKLRLLRND